MEVEVGGVMDRTSSDVGLWCQQFVNVLVPRHKRRVLQDT
jgi:hypothetical protein